MSQLRKGIVAAGNWIVDLVKTIDLYPDQDALANILSERAANGGSPYNLLKDLAKLEAPFPLQAIGLVGNDANGHWIIADCNQHGIGTHGLKMTEAGSTSYTDVMTVASTGRRTFFHNRGVNAQLSPADLDLSAYQDYSHFHLGYLLLLDGLDQLDADGRTGASHVLAHAQQLGFTTSADLVSESSDRFKTLVPPSLPYIDYLFANEYEAEKVTGIAIGSQEQFNLPAAEAAARQLLTMGVKQWVVLHFPQGSLAVAKDQPAVYQPSLSVPVDYIKGANGAGDAFAAGTLYGLLQDWTIDQCLMLGVSAAAASLGSSTCSDAVLPAAACQQLAQDWGFRS